MGTLGMILGTLVALMFFDPIVLLIALSYGFAVDERRHLINGLLVMPIVTNIVVIMFTGNISIFIIVMRTLATILLILAAYGIRKGIAIIRRQVAAY